MVTLLTPPAPTEAEQAEEVQVQLSHGLTGADRAFRILLASSGFIVLVVIISILAFLVANGWQALHTFKLSFFTGTTWSIPLHPGVLGILAGSVLIALIAITVGLPIWDSSRFFAQRSPVATTTRSSSADSSWPS
jgi:phosphate transport system permease protein